MKNDSKNLLPELVAITLFFNLLFFSKETVLLASKGLMIWYHNMIPTLFPFMVLSGFLVRTGIAVRISRRIQRLLKPLISLSPPMFYTIIMGFLCGFPMGAKVIGDLMERKQLSLEEGQYLLAFCNNIGPLYILGYVQSLFGWKSIGQILLIFYGLPLVYGLFLLPKPKTTLSLNRYLQTDPASCNWLEGLQASLQAAVEQITLLGGCMVFFNCLQIYPKLLMISLSRNLPQLKIPALGILGSLTEIGGGLEQLAATSLRVPVLLVLTLMTFGGLGCIMQTCFLLKNSGLSMRNYLKHKLLQSSLFFLLLLISKMI